MTWNLGVLKHPPSTPVVAPLPPIKHILFECISVLFILSSTQNDKSTTYHFLLNYNDGRIIVYKLVKMKKLSSIKK